MCTYARVYIINLKCLFHIVWLMVHVRSGYFKKFTYYFVYALQDAQMFINKPLTIYLRILSILRLVKKTSGWLVFLAAAAFYLSFNVFDCEWFANEWHFFHKKMWQVIDCPLDKVQCKRYTKHQFKQNNIGIWNIFFKLLYFFF